MMVKLVDWVYIVLRYNLYIINILIACQSIIRVDELGINIVIDCNK